MTRRLKSPLALAALAIAGILVFAAGAAAVKPADAAPEPAAQVTNAAAAPTTTSAPVESTDSSIPPTIPTTPIAPPPTIPIEEALADVVASAPPPHRPERVYIGSIGVDATIIDLGLNPDRTLEVPEDIRLTGWWTGRSVPGEEGPSIVVGHVDSAAAGPGVFWRLRELDIGDVIHIERSDGSISEFRVIETELVLKDEFPTEKVYGSTEGSQLRLITCGGSFDQSARSYLGNVIVYAEHVGTTQLPPPPSLGSAV
jgi:sortase (surface protein transpeptidase)